MKKIGSRSEPLRLHRLIDRGLSEDDARPRMQAQVSESEREALADLVVVNDGDLVSLAEAARAGLKRFGPASAGGCDL